MENSNLRERCNAIIEKIKSDLSGSKQCIAAYLLGSFSHDKIWEWSDIQIAVVLDDGYRGKTYYTLIEDGMPVVLNIFTLTAFKKFIGTANIDNFMWKAFSKSQTLFSKDIILDELLEDAFYIGEVDKQKELLLGFSGAVYYLNKAEKNLYVKENLENVIYFIPQIAENIAWIEIFKNGEIPERELIPQGKRLNPAIFAKIYDPLFLCGGGEAQDVRQTSALCPADYAVIKNILENCLTYLEEDTEMIYQPIIAYLKQHGNLEHFQYDVRPHGFGINYEWLVRCGIAERYGISEKVPFLKESVYKLGYRLK